MPIHSACFAKPLPPADETLRESYVGLNAPLQPGQGDVHGGRFLAKKGLGCKIGEGDSAVTVHGDKGSAPFDARPLLAAALNGHDIGLVSEAGMPAVADPGSSVVRAAHDLGLRVVPLVGPVSLLLALAASGLNGQNFAFVGYLPQDGQERTQRIKELELAGKVKIIGNRTHLEIWNPVTYEELERKRGGHA